MKYNQTLKMAFNVLILFLLGVTAILFCVLYINTFEGGFFYKYKNLIISLVTICISILIVVSIIFTTKDNNFIFKLTIITLILVALSLIILYLLKISGILDKIDSIESLRNYVASFGYMAIFIYTLINFLQVVILPIPGFISVGTGVALFGALKTSIFSYIGIVVGSFVAFFIGRNLGYKVVAWLIGEDSLKKWLKNIKNKDIAVLTFMFLFPLFPDDVLCFVAGITSMSGLYFTIMILLCRFISIFTTAYSLNGSIIPYTTWWGITIWIIIGILTIIGTYFIYKKGDKIEKFFTSKFNKGE